VPRGAPSRRGRPRGGRHGAGVRALVTPHLFLLSQPPAHAHPPRPPSRPAENTLAVTDLSPPPDGVERSQLPQCWGGLNWDWFSAGAYQPPGAANYAYAVIPTAGAQVIATVAGFRSVTPLTAAVRFTTNADGSACAPGSAAALTVKVPKRYTFNQFVAKTFTLPCVPAGSGFATIDLSEVFDGANQGVDTYQITFQNDSPAANVDFLSLTYNYCTKPGVSG
jgi:hypothetical protein